MPNGAATHTVRFLRYPSQSPQGIQGAEEVEVERQCVITLGCRTETPMPSIPVGYRQVAEDLRARIAAGEYPAGSRLPTIAKLAERYGTSDTTVKKAVLLLQTQGVIVGVQGAGLYVPEG